MTWWQPLVSEINPRACRSKGRRYEHQVAADVNAAGIVQDIDDPTHRDAHRGARQHDPVVADRPVAAAVHIENVLRELRGNSVRIGWRQDEIAVLHDACLEVVAVDDGAKRLRLAFVDHEFQIDPERGDELHATVGIDPVEHDALEIGVASPPCAVEHNGALVVVYDAVLHSDDE